MARRPNTPELIVARLVVGPVPTNPSRPLSTPCLLWPDGCMPSGYGSVSIGNRTYLVHRVVYEHLVGPLPDRSGDWLDHVCRVRRCANVEHLELVSATQNQLRRADVMAGRCARGHDLTDEANVYRPPAHPCQRQCRTCRREASRRYRLLHSATSPVTLPA